MVGKRFSRNISDLILLDERSQPSYQSPTLYIEDAICMHALGVEISSMIQDSKNEVILLLGLVGTQHLIELIREVF